MSPLVAVVLIICVIVFLFWSLERECSDMERERLELQMQITENGPYFSKGEVVKYQNCYVRIISLTDYLDKATHAQRIIEESRSYSWCCEEKEYVEFENGKVKRVNKDELTPLSEVKKFIYENRRNK